LSTPFILFGEVKSKEGAAIVRLSNIKVLIREVYA